MSKDRAAQLVEAGIWLKLSGDREGARKLFERALKLDPENEKASQLLAGGLAPGEGPPPPSAPEPVAVASVPPMASTPTPPPGTNPFEPPLRTPSPSDLDWGAAAGVNPVEAPTPEASLDSDWGRMTGAATPIPQPNPALIEPPKPTAPGWASSPSSSNPNPNPPTSPSGVSLPPSWASSGSGLTGAPRQTMVAWGGSAGSGLERPAPKQTLMFTSPSGVTEAPAPKNTMVFAGSSGSSPRNTLVGWGDAATLPVEGAPPVDPAPPPQVVSLSGEAPPASPPSSTPPLFAVEAPVALPAPVVVPEVETTQPLFATLEPPASAPAPVPQVVQIGGDPGPEVPPPSTPPIFAGPPPSAPPLPVPAADDAIGFAWSWSSSPVAAPTAPPEPGPVPASFEVPPLVEEPPVPRPSPSLAPRAESAWDARSNPGIKLEAIVGHDRALDLISSDSKSNHPAPTPGEEVKAILRGARDLLDLDDHTGAMELIVKAQKMAPDDPDVQLMKERSEKTLLNMFESKLGKIETIPRVLLKEDEIIWLNLDHRAGFVLAQIDGSVSFDDLFSVSGMSRIDTARILAQLVEEGVISRG